MRETNRALLSNQQNSFLDRRMTKDEINACPVRKYSGQIHVIRTEAELDRAMSILKKETLLGFDTETRPAFRKGESYLPIVLQLAGERDVFIFQLRHLGFLPVLRSLLSDPQIVKAGVSLDYDVQELKKLAKFKPAGFVDMGKWAKKIGIKNLGLRGLAAVMLGFRISKSAQRSNWANDVLTPSQLTYAATDAWVGRELYKKAQKLG